MIKYDVITVPSGQNIEAERMRSKLKIMELEQKLKELQEAVKEVRLNDYMNDAYSCGYGEEADAIKRLLEVLKKQGVSDERALLVG